MIAENHSPQYNTEPTQEAQQPNIDQSVSPGLTVYLVPAAAENLYAFFGEHDELLQYREQLIPIAEDGSLFALRLDSGAYSMGWGMCRFRDRAEVTDGTIDWERSSDGFHVGYNYVVRVEGDGGEIWQNWHYTALGNRKA